MEQPVAATTHNMAMTDNVSKETEISHHDPLLSDTEMWYLNLYLNGLCGGLVAAFGVANNIINMVIFFRLGLKDSMGIGLFFLALTDCCLCLVFLSSRVFPLWDVFFETDHLNPMDIFYAGFDWVADSLFFCSGCITTFLAMERSICVTFPFKVKQIFPRKRSFLVLVAIYLTTASLYVPVYMSHRLQWVTDQIQTSNTTSTIRRLVLIFSHIRPQVEIYVDTVGGLILPVTLVVLILGLVFWMAYSLNMSNQIRAAMTAKKTERHMNKQDEGMTSKTQRLVKVVVLLAHMFTTCSAFRMFTIHVFLLNPEIKHNGKETNYYTFQWNVSSLASVVNSSANIFVYISVNSNYRAKLKELFRG